LIARRTLFKIAGGSLAGGVVLRPHPSASAEGSLERSEVNARDPRFGASGNFWSDDTIALQAAANYCFGAPSAPHGTAAVNSNRALHVPPGNYKITSPIRLAQLHGGRIIGAGRFVTKITNVASGPVFVTNGCGYSHFEGMYLESSSKDAAVFDLNWDGRPGGPALQSNAFIDMFFDGGGVGIDIGADGYMGSENIFVNCFWMRQTIAGLKTSNFNALQNTIVGGNFQTCGIGVWVYRGSVPLVESVGFQQSKEWDIRVDNSANDTLTVIGCRTESSNFAKIWSGVHAVILGCSQTEAGAAGYFLQPGGCPVTIERCVSLKGQIALAADARLTVRGCSFGRTDWLAYAPLNSGQVIELEDVQYGGTPNSRGHAQLGRVFKQRITSAGIFDYKLKAAE
jgi:hypothetical protein